MSLAEQVHIDIDGFRPKVIYYDLQVAQTMASHHHFSFLWRHSDSVVTDLSDQGKMVRTYLGRDVIFTFKSSGGTTVKSKGIITSLESVDSQGSSAGLLVQGMSHTLFIDDMQKSRTFLDNNLKEIVKKIVIEGPGDFYQSGDIAPTFSDTIAYSAQYNETNFDYLKRLATRYGQWFYWDGMRLQFGLTKSSSVKLLSGSSLHEFKIQTCFVAHKVALSGYDYSSGSNTRAASRKTTTGSGDGFAAHIAQKQHDYFTPDTAVSAYSGQAYNEAELNAMVKLETAAKDANSVYYSGISYEPLSLGKTFTIMNQKIEHNVVAVEVTHLSDNHGNYSCSFKAIPSDVSAPPYTNTQIFAKAETQPAKVIDNNDPQGMGRVKTSFNWGRGSTETEWIRLVQPHAGSGKGFHFIPEVGEEVLVGFEGANAEKPYVIGTHYNGSESSSYTTAGNDQKVIHTRSGTKMIFNDAQGSVFIEDPSGNTWMMDGKGNISVNAPKNFVVNAGEDIIYNAGGNIIASANQNVNIIAGESITELANDDYVLTASNITETAQIGRSSTAKNITENMEKGNMISSKNAIHVESAKEVNINSGKKVKMQ